MRPTLPVSGEVVRQSQTMCITSHRMALAAIVVVDWRTLLNCVNLVTLVGLTLGAVGAIVGILGWFASVRGLREAALAKEREKTAQQAAREARQDLLHQRAAEDFRAIAEKVQQLFGAVTSKKWKIVGDLLLPVKRQLSEANGSFRDILKGIEMDKLDVAISAVKSLITAVQELESESTVVTAETVPTMTAQCDVVADLINEIYGKLKYLKVEEVQ
jgi:hypothetical protein